MKYNFDEIFDRRHNLERKNNDEYIFANYKIKGDDVINASIADLDFLTPEPICKAIIDRAEKRTYSYTFVPESVGLAVEKWYKKTMSIAIDKNKMKLVHGTVNALHQLIACLTKPGESVLINTPVYGPFSRAVHNNNRNLIVSALYWNETTNRYELDLADMESKIKNNNVKLYILCNPHNPGGIVWSKNDIEMIVNLCKKHDVFLISDEVHSGLVYEQFAFSSLLKWFDKYQHIIVCNSPNKAFNIGGFKSSYLIINDDAYRKNIDEYYVRHSLTSPNVFVVPSLIAAYEKDDCYDWVNQMKSYVWNNFAYFTKQFAADERIRIMAVQASFLLWIEFSATGLSAEEFKRRSLAEHLILDYNEDFSIENDKQFARVNIGCPKSRLEEIVIRLKKIFS